MKPNVIRPIAICVFYNNGRILAARFRHPQSDQVFYRPLGGGIEFGEYSADAIVREIHEELGTAVVDVRYLATLENVFTYNGQTGHEIVVVYDAAFADPALYEQTAFVGDDNGQLLDVVWLSLADCRLPDAPPVYPTGLLALVEEAHAKDAK
jgi:8-oxo-dGTP pyrophosphatase MutT (NUDIX family)